MKFSSDESAAAMSTYASMSTPAAAAAAVPPSASVTASVAASASVADALAAATTTTTSVASASAFYSPPLPPDDGSVFPSASANSSSPLYCAHIPAIRIGGREAQWRQSSQSTSTIENYDRKIGNESRKIVDSQVGVCSKDEITGSSRNREEVTTT